MSCNLYGRILFNNINNTLILFEYFKHACNLILFFTSWLAPVWKYRSKYHHPRLLIGSDDRPCSTCIIIFYYVYDSTIIILLLLSSQLLFYCIKCINYVRQMTPRTYLIVIKVYILICTNNIHIFYLSCYYVWCIWPISMCLLFIVMDV